MFGEHPFAAAPMGAVGEAGPETFVYLNGFQIQIQIGCYHVSAWPEISEPSNTWSSMTPAASSWGQINVTANVWNEVC